MDERKIRFETHPLEGISWLVVSGPWDNQWAEFVRKEGIEALYLNYTKGWKGENLDFLAECPHLTKLKVLDWGISDVRGISALSKLEYLSLHCKPGKAPDFSALSRLKSCTLSWMKGGEPLFECKALEHLGLDGYSGTSLGKIGSLSGLRELGLSNATKLASLDGIGGLARLESLTLTRLGSLVSLGPVAALSALERLTLTQCRKVGDVKALAALPKLKHLVLEEMGELESLTPLEKVPSLESLQFIGTKVADGKLGGLKCLPNLSDVLFENRRHYSHKCEDFPQRTPSEADRRKAEEMAKFVKGMFG